MHTKHHEEIPQSAATIQSDREPRGEDCTETAHSLSRCLQHTLQHVSAHLNRAPNSSLGSARLQDPGQDTTRSGPHP